MGRHCGYSASQISRWETGRLSLRDFRLLRTLADATPPSSRLGPAACLG
ncbi:MAG: hypothetical protein ACRDQX_08575 [Pseudonocardiaceae bacterium]